MAKGTKRVHRIRKSLCDIPETPKANPSGSAFGAANKPKPTRGDEIRIPSPMTRLLYGDSDLRVEKASAASVTLTAPGKGFFVMKIEPRISASKLVEYCFARSTRRTAIIEDIIRPKNFLLDTRYNEIERAMMHFIETHGQDDSRLFQLDRALLSRQPATSHDEQRLLTAHDAIELCRTMSLAKLPTAAKLTGVSDSQPKFLLAGVSISVRPTNSVKIPQAGRREFGFGLIKPYLSKTLPLSPETSALHGALLHWYAEKCFGDAGEPRAELCFVVDVFAQKTFAAPGSFNQRRKLLAASCQEIADRWQSIRARLITDEEASRKRH